MNGKNGGEDGGTVGRIEVNLKKGNPLNFILKMRQNSHNPTTPVVSAVLRVSAERRAEAIQRIVTPTHVKLAVTHRNTGINATITALKGWFKHEIAFVYQVLSTRLANLPFLVGVPSAVVSTKSA